MSHMPTYIVNLGKSQYEHHEMYMMWCDKNIGHGGWDQFGRQPLPDDFEWSIGCMFGTCNYSFKTEEDKTKFEKYIETAI